MPQAPPGPRRPSKYLHEKVWSLDGEQAAATDPLSVVSRFADAVYR